MCPPSGSSRNSHLPSAGDDSILLRKDPITRRTTLDTPTDSTLGRFLEQLPELWPQRTVLHVYSSLTAKQVHHEELRHAVQRHIRDELWRKLGEQAVMPLTKPTINWELLTGAGHAWTFMNDENIARLVEHQPTYPITPDMELPDHSVVICHASVPTIPLPSAG